MSISRLAAAALQCSLMVTITFVLPSFARGNRFESIGALPHLPLSHEINTARSYSLLQSGPIATFNWSVEQRSRSYAHYSQITHMYDPEYVHPIAWTIVLNGCYGEYDAPGLTYKWVIRRGLVLERVIESEKCAIIAGAAPDGNGHGAPSAGAGVAWSAWDPFGSWPVELRPPTPAEPLIIDPLPGPGPFHVTLTVTDSLGREDRDSQIVRLEDRLVVVIGDSSASGQGNPAGAGQFTRSSDIKKCSFNTLQTYASLDDGETLPMDPPPTWTEPAGYRSMRSGFARAVHDLDFGDPHSTFTFLHFANSGAEIRNGLLESQGRYKVGPEMLSIGQIDEVRRSVGDRPIDALLISVGVNDAGFSKLLEEGIKGSLFHDRANVVEMAIAAVHDSLPIRFAALAAELERLNPARILIVGYPVDIFGPRSCGIFAINPDEIAYWADAVGYKDADGFTARERQFVSNLGVELNRQVALAALTYGWDYIAVADRFAEHGYCSGQSYFTSAEHSCIIQGDFEGTMHPNPIGQYMYQEEIAKALRRLLEL